MSMFGTVFLGFPKLFLDSRVKLLHYLLSHLLNFNP
jgi:hypothetical protein